MYTKLNALMKIQGKETCLKLKKSIYGLKQAGRVWNQTFTKFLASVNLRKSDTDSCLFVDQEGSVEDYFAIALYVDDLLVIHGNTPAAKAKMAGSHQLSLGDMGAPGGD